MKKKLILLLMTMLPLAAMAHDIEAPNADGVMIYYKWGDTNNELSVSFEGKYLDSGIYSGDIIIPPTVYYDGKTYTVTSISNYAFYKCTNLISVTIPNTVTKLGYSIFSDCTNLTSVYIPNSITKISGNTFLGCSALKTITIPNSVTIIDDQAFKNCSSLTSINIPDGVKTINEGTFNGCTSLPSINIPFSVTSIGTNSFSRCSSLSSISIPNSVTKIKSCAFAECTGLTSVSIGNSVKIIEEAAFEGCSNLINITIPNSVTEVRWNVFQDCTSLKNLIIGNGVVNIGEKAFKGCTNLTSVTMGNNVTSIGSNAFEKCNALTSVNIEDMAAWCNISFYDYFSNPIYYARHIYYKGEEVKDLVIPEGVTTIQSYAFRYCTSLTSVTFPNSLKGIKGSAFEGCSNLTAMHIKDMAAWCNTSLYNTESNPLTYAKHLYLNGEEVFDLVIPDGVTTIYSYAFYNCTSFISVTIPPSVSKVGLYAFRNCSSLNAVNISDITAWCNIKFTTSSNPLYNAAHLYLNGVEISNLIIPHGLESIGEYIFYGCKSLNSVIIPSSVNSIHCDAFYSCSKITSVKIFATTPPDTHDNAFSKFSISLYVPDSSIDLYRNTRPWKNFKNILPISEVLAKGDANNDNKVTISDAVGVVNYLLGTPSYNFIFDAADVNSDDKVTITDAVGVINIMLNNGESGAPALEAEGKEAE